MARNKSEKEVAADREGARTEDLSKAYSKLKRSAASAKKRMRKSQRDSEDLMMSAFLGAAASWMMSEAYAKGLEKYDGEK